jgi:hypothetical protein
VKFSHILKFKILGCDNVVCVPAQTPRLLCLQLLPVCLAKIGVNNRMKGSMDAPPVARAPLGDLTNKIQSIF